MTRSRSLLGMLVLLTATLVVAAAWLVLHNPSIDGTSRGDDYPCLAPYDTVLNNADNVPGGEPAPDGDEIGTRCRSLGQKRFNQGLAAGSAAVALGAVTMLLAVRRVRSKGARPL